MVTKPLRIGITGTRGFIGSHLLETLDKNSMVGVIPLVRSSKSGRLESKFLKKKCNQLDFIYHLGGVNRGTDEEILSGNIINTQNLISALLENGKPFPHLIFASSGQIYQPSTKPIGEGKIIRPPTVYGIAKKAAEDLIRISGIPFTILRLSNVYGPKCKAKYNSVVATFCENAIKKNPLIIHGKGNQGRDFIYIEDVIDAFLKVGKFPSKKQGVFNLSSAKVTTLNQIAKKIKDIRPATKINFIETADIGPKAYCLDNSKFKKRFKWKPSVSLEKGIIQTLKWFERLK